MCKETSSELSLVMFCWALWWWTRKKVSSIPRWVVCVEKDAVACVSWQAVRCQYRVDDHRGVNVRGL